MSIKVAYTPEGTVIREIWPGGEQSYRLNNTGFWDRCLDHKGPWVQIRHGDVPQSIKDALEEAHTNAPQ